MVTNRLLALAVLIGTSFLVQPASAEHEVYRQGPHGHIVYRRHSLGANGAAVITQGLQLGMPILGTFVNNVTKDAAEEKSATKGADMAGCADLAEQQRQANVLLARTANLVNNLPPATTPTASVRINRTTGQPVSDEEDKTMFGGHGNPWPIQP